MGGYTFQAVEMSNEVIILTVGTFGPTMKKTFAQHCVHLDWPAGYQTENRSKDMRDDRSSNDSEP
jgi:hypothetical protein